jgi:hypothetical protein
LKLIHTDILTWDNPNNIQYDIVLSELLGGFGDNELAPEIIFPAEK